MGRWAIRVTMVIALVVATACGGDGGEEASAPEDVPAGVTPIDGFPDRQEPAVVAVGDRLFVFGGQVPPPLGRDARVRYLNDGVLVDPTSGESETLPEAPFDRPLAHPAAVRVGDAVVVIGSLCVASAPVEGNAEFCEPNTYAAARFDLSDREWTRIAMTPELASVTGGHRTPLGVLDGGAVFVLGPASPEAWTYAPADDRWSQLPASLGSDSVCLAGSNLVELVLTQDATQSSTPSLRLTDLTTGASRQSAPVPGVVYRPFVGGALSCRTDQILVVDPGDVGGAAGVHRYDAAGGAWSTLPAPPRDLFGFRPVWAGDELAFMPTPDHAGSPAFALDPVAGRWRSIPDPPPFDPAGALGDGRVIAGYAGPGLVPDGSPAVVCLSGTVDSPPTTSDRPECRPDSRPPEPRRARAGVWSFTIPPP